MTDRQERILKKIISLYIKSAQPISSSSISIGFCPATVRHEMHRLTEEGYLVQPHTSAGRVPSDKAYRFFVDVSRQRDIEVPAIKERDIWRLFQEATRSLADLSSALVLSGLLEEKVFFKEGWSEVLDDPEFNDQETTLSFLRWLQELEDNMDDFAGSTTVYIGEENPIPAGRNFSLIISGCGRKKKRGIVAICGPKRMAYDRNLALIESMIQQIEDYV